MTSPPHTAAKSSHPPPLLVRRSARPCGGSGCGHVPPGVSASDGAGSQPSCGKRKEQRAPRAAEPGASSGNRIGEQAPGRSSAGARGGGASPCQLRRGSVPVSPQRGGAPRSVARLSRRAAGHENPGEEDPPPLRLDADCLTSRLCDASQIGSALRDQVGVDDAHHPPLGARHSSRRGRGRPRALMELNLARTVVQSEPVAARVLSLYVSAGGGGGSGAERRRARRTENPLVQRADPPRKGRRRSGGRRWCGSVPSHFTVRAERGGVAAPVRPTASVGRGVAGEVWRGGPTGVGECRRCPR